MKHRLLNPVMEESLRQQIDLWLEQRVVEEANSPWSFPLVPVPEKNSQEVRWAVDYRRLNAVTKKDAFPLPNIADNLSRLAGSRVFSALDGAGAFHAVRSDAPTERKGRSLLHLGNTSLSGCPLAWPTPRPLTPDSSPKHCTIYPPQKSSATWTTRLPTPGMLGAIYVSSARSWQPSVRQVSRSPLGRPNCSEIISNISDTKSVPKKSAFPRTTRQSSRTGWSPTLWRL